MYAYTDCKGTAALELHKYLGATSCYKREKPKTLLAKRNR